MSASAAIRRGFTPALQAFAERARERVAPLREKYARDPFLLADEGLVSILDLETHREVPFTLWGHQREVVEAWVRTEHLAKTGELRFANVHEEKSRQMGLTWITAYVAAWALNFHPVRGLALSQKLGEVCDSGPSTDSFFGRVWFIHQSMPEEIRAQLIVTGGNDPIIRNPAYVNAFLTGEGATPDAGRGGNYEYVLLDEAARIPWGRLVHSSVSRACPDGRFYNSTPAGEDPLYFWLRDKRPAGYVFLRHHWSRNPIYARGLHVAALAPDAQTGELGTGAAQPSKEMKLAANECPLCQGTIEGIQYDPEDTGAHRYPGKLTSPWYEKAVAELTDEQVAQELDIDYSGSLPARVYTEFSEERNVVDSIAYDRRLPIELAFDYGWEMNAVGIFQDAPREYRMVGEFEAPDLIPEQLVAGLHGALLGIGVAKKDLQRFNTLNWLAVGDPAGDATNLRTGRPLTADYSDLGFSIRSRRRPVDQTIIAVKRLLMGRPKRLVISREHCPRAITHLKNNKWETDRNGNRKPNAKLQNDEHNHLCRAVAYLIAHKFPPPSVKETVAVATKGDSGKLDEGLSYDMPL